MTVEKYTPKWARRYFEVTKNFMWESRINTILKKSYDPTEPSLLKLGKK